MYDAFGNKYNTCMVQVYKLVMIELNTKLQRIREAKNYEDLEYSPRREDLKRETMGSLSCVSTSGGVAIQKANL